VAFKILTGWLDTRSLRHSSVMAFVPLTDDELARAALGARSLAFMHENKSKASEQPELHAEQARRFRALAERFEQARTPSRGA